MLSTLIYRSRMRGSLSAEELHQLADAAGRRNQAIQVTGILLFDGVHFFQVLEGPDEHVDALYRSILRDARHTQIVRLLRDHAPSRRFGGNGMELFDLRRYTAGTVLDALLARVTARNRQTYDDRVLKIIKACAAGEWKDHFVEGSDASEWSFAPGSDIFAAAGGVPLTGQPCQFALQPIVDPLRREVSSLEALIRSASGGSPEAYFASIPQGKLHQADLEAKAYAFALVNRIGIGDCKISVNLLPMSLVAVPGAVDILLEQLARNNLAPEQLVVEVTEQEFISRLDGFTTAITQLRRAGIGLAIDDFGAGFAGLSLLVEFQPEKLKIDRKLIHGVHADGPRQAIVRSIVQFCASLGITIVAEGVETAEDWCWLQAAGIERFQGYLFARPALNGVAPIWWPSRKC
ncbi:diguanylate phosphodiesterase [Bordetella genomosp. 8]|uniref:Diguanylate phosphodiesterase n=1 Tax=Bordetella genomosp. 8 TaxID=1416806 RepID=A0A1W6YKU1_9BORD|nr:diguanylate phosphodiesterase [Bordetella genomosp. 8]ARP81705.1 diguanylate phosphodiesterase [Bordetella genomosp. 8]